MDFVSDLWIPFQDAIAYMNKARTTLDMAVFCGGYQISPVYHPDTGGGLYPDKLRVAVVRDREIPIMAGDVLNNPAYGGGMSPQGMINRHVFILNSREMIRQNKITLEETNLVADNTELHPAAFARALSMAALQETKGRMIDAMYSRDAVLSQLPEHSRAYEKTKPQLDESVESLSQKAAAQDKVWEYGPVSGYDADIDYLRRKSDAREAALSGDPPSAIAFSADPQREQSIESGYAMRKGVVYTNYENARAPLSHKDQRENRQPDGHNDNAGSRHPTTFSYTGER